MIKILANDGLHPEGLRLLQQAGYQVDLERVPQEKLPEVLPDYDVIIVRSATKVREDLIARCPRLKVIARAGVGLDNIDVSFAERQGIAVVNTPGASAVSVAELAFGHMFALARYLHLSNRLMPAEGRTNFKALKKQFSSGMELRGRTLGVIGFGKIGLEVVRMGLALGMNVLAVDLRVEEVQVDLRIYDTNNVSLSVQVCTVPFEEALRRSDFITLHVPAQKNGKALIGKEEMAQMKEGVILINTARGGLIDEEALLEALDSGKVRGAGLDVFEGEPQPRQELLEHPRVSVSPHIGASTGEAQANIGQMLAGEIIKRLAGVS